MYTGIQDTTKMTACVVAGKRNNGKARENWWHDKAMEKGGSRKDWWAITQPKFASYGWKNAHDDCILQLSQRIADEIHRNYASTLLARSGEGPLENTLPPTAAFSLRVSSSFEKLVSLSADDAILSRIFRRHVDQPTEKRNECKSSGDKSISQCILSKSVFQ